MSTSNPLRLHWFICAGIFSSVIAYNLLCQIWGAEIRFPLEESQRILIRSILYGVTIALLPLVNLLRHILLRLNQTMPGPQPAAQRYLVTIIITQGLIEGVSLFGLIMYILGDDFNTLYIFSLISLLGIYLHRPKPIELQAITAALAAKEHKP